MLLCNSCIDELYKIESRLIKICIGISNTADSASCYKAFGLHNCKYRQELMSKRLLDNEIIRFKGEMSASTRSGKLTSTCRYFSVNDKLAILALNHKTLNEMVFDLNYLKTWKAEQNKIIKLYVTKGSD